MCIGKLSVKKPTIKSLLDGKTGSSDHFGTITGQQVDVSFAYVCVCQIQGRMKNTK